MEASSTGLLFHRALSTTPVRTLLSSSNAVAISLPFTNILIKALGLKEET
jgi:hypothetical protein